MVQAEAAWCELQARGVAIGNPAMALFHSKEEALVRLALNEAASEGEIEVSAVKLIRALRARGLDPEVLITGKELALAKPKPQTVTDPGEVVFEWGKWRGSAIKSVPKKYLRWVLWKCARAEICPVIRAYLGIPQK
jgi:hypothetical protein